jgi:dephospho-CoA kinase
MHVYGITGPSGAGKSMLCEYMSRRGVAHIDADKIYHGLLVPPSDVLDALRESFGTKIFTADGVLDRAVLSAIVFNDKEKLALLNETVLGFVLKEIRRRIRSLEKDGFTAVAVDAPTLIESGFHKECDTVITVLSSTEVRVARIMERDGISRKKAEERIKAQKPDEFYEEYSDIVLINDGDTEAFFSLVTLSLPELL